MRKQEKNKEKQRLKEIRKYILIFLKKVLTKFIKSSIILPAGLKK